MDRRKAWCLAVAGHSTVQTDQGPGFMWDGANTEYVIAFTRYLLGKYPLEKSRVIVWGHSAGGTMTLETLTKAPAGLYAGGLTTAAPATPTSAHKEMRVCVFLGTTDPNWGGAGTVRAHLENLEKKRSKGACAFFAVQGLGHNVPDEDYLDLGLDWVLAGEARGGEASVPQRCQGREGDWRHVLVRYKGAEGAPSDLKRTRSAAEKVLKELLKDLEKGRAFFPFEAACHSDDAATAGGGGGIGEAALKAIVGEIPAVEPGKVSAILETPQGLDLVFRPGP
jgi:hypothetical protein